MSYNVFGFVEVRFEPEPGWDLAEWRGLIDLDPLHLIGDQVSAKLFGLTKYPKQPGLFEKRGVPSDASKTVRAWVAENDAFIAQHGEGYFGHTHALWSEITAIDLEGLHTEASGWKLLFAMLPPLIAPCFYKPEQIRIVVAALW